MKKILATFAITAALAGSAVAADLPVKARPMAPAPVMATNWTGCYVGGGGGYGMFWQRHQTLTPTQAPATALSADAGGRGWFGTVQAGCDYQISPRWVIGVFGDYDFSNIKGDLATTALFATAAGTGNLVGEERLRNSWQVGGRIGYLIFPGLLGYVSGGYSNAQFSGVSFNLLQSGAPTTVTLDSQRYNGYFIGTGYEYALDFLPGVFWKTEYRYASYRAQNPAIFDGATLVGYENSRKEVHTVRSELVYRFNWGGPVVAKY